MKISETGFAALICFVILVSCVNTGQVNKTSNNLSPVEKTIFVQHRNNLPDTFLNNLLSKYPLFFNSILSKKEEMRIQIIYTQIDRGKKLKDKPKFTDHTFNLDADNYFYPASTVKLPIAILEIGRASCRERV